jgi:hypothetical protein
MSRIRFDPTFNVGHLITAGGLIAALIGIYVGFDYRLTALEKLAERQAIQVERLSTVVIDSARFEERFKNYGHRLDSLERR